MYIVYTVFCRTFMDETSEYKISEILLVAVYVLIFVLLIMATSWLALNLIFSKQPELIVMGYYGCHHKTVAMGLPLIKAIYEEDPKVGMYCLPLLVWHPGQLLIGSLMTSTLKKWVKEKRS